MAMIRYKMCHLVLSVLMAASLGCNRALAEAVPAALTL
jgi:hypothetical protein